jgi:hypothetical protein
MTVQNRIYFINEQKTNLFLLKTLRNMMMIMRMHDERNAMQQRRKAWRLLGPKAFPIEKVRLQKNQLSGQICLELIKEKRKAFVKDSLMSMKKKSMVG